MAHVVIIGSGIAGLFTACKLADAGHEVTVVTKQRPKDSSTNWAQGGIAAILDKTNEDGMESHDQDTLKSGDDACDEDVVRSIISEAGERIVDLINIGVEFEKHKDGTYALIREGGHSTERILHAKDATGREIERALTSYADSHANIAMKPNTLAIDLIQRRHGQPSQGGSGGLVPGPGHTRGVDVGSRRRDFGDGRCWATLEGNDQPKRGYRRRFGHGL